MSESSPRRPAPRPRGAVPGGSAYRPDIEGLRAVAVVLVVLFHASILGFAGGFVGVDVFFVISGFLITGLLLREVDATGTISLQTFYARRVRRLLPAAALVLLVTLAASVLLLPPLVVPNVAGDVAAAAMYVSNIGFAFQATDYFAAAQAPSPILHYWSLGVEEQFYLFWPAILLVVATLARGRALRIGLTVMGISIASFAFSLWLTSADAPWAFFSLPTRAWELGLGAMLAVAGTQLGRIPGRAATAAGWAGLGLILLAAVLFDQSTPFPGTAALLPTLGAALVIAGGVRATAIGPARILNAAVPRFFGRISYSLYLWHWPVLVIPAEVAGATLPLPERLALVGVAVILAAATQRWVEDPFRRGRIVGTVPRRNIAMAGALALVVAVVSIGTGFASEARLRGSSVTTTAAANERSLDQVLNQLASEAPSGVPTEAGTIASPDVTPDAAGATPAATSSDATATGSPLPSSPAAGSQAPAATASLPPNATASLPPTRAGPVPANLQPSIVDAHGDIAASYTDGCHTQADGHPSVGTCLYGNLASKTTIALFGDSHALAWFPAVERLAERQGWRLLSLTMSTCSPADIPIYNDNYKRVSTECTAWRQNAVDRLVQTRPDIILVAGTRGFATVDSSGRILTGDARTSAWEAGITRTLKRLIPAAGTVIYIADPPLSRFDPPVCLSEHLSDALACATPLSYAISQPWLSDERLMADRLSIGFIDPDLWVCPSSPCPAVLGNILIYRDAGHLTATFSSALAGRLLDAIDVELARLGRPVGPG